MTFLNRWKPDDILRNMNTHEETTSEFIIGFDGYCNLCNRWVDYLIKKDHNDLFRFTALQSEVGKRFFVDKGYKESELETLETIVVFNRAGISVKSDAVMNILIALGWPYKMVVIFRVVPVTLRNIFYDSVAKRRFNWFGRKKTCRIPSQDEKSKFLG